MTNFKWKRRQKLRLINVVRKYFFSMFTHLLLLAFPLSLAGKKQGERRQRKNAAGSIGISVSMGWFAGIRGEGEDNDPENSPFNVSYYVSSPETKKVGTLSSFEQAIEEIGRLLRWKKRTADQYRQEQKEAREQQSQRVIAHANAIKQRLNEKKEARLQWMQHLLVEAAARESAAYGNLNERTLEPTE